MPRDKSPLVIQAEYLPIRIIWPFLRLIPFTWAYYICRMALKFLFFGVIPKRKKIMESNLALCFPEKTMQERQKIAEDSITNLARGIAYVPRLPALGQDDMLRWIRPEGFEHAEAAFKAGKGMITIAGHYGFWEAMIIYLNKYCGKTAGVARALDNPLLNNLIHQVRTSTGSRVIYQHQILKEGMRWLRSNGLLGILIDQNFYKGGIFVDFFGRPAATTTIASLLARRTGSPIMPIQTIWEGDLLRIILDPPLVLSINPDNALAIAEDTQMMTKVVEGWIRKEPGQWMWLHNRWKRQPVAGDFIYNGS